MFLTLIANVLILIAFKLFPRFKVNNFNAIIINYFVAVITGSIVLGGIPFDKSALGQAWFPYAAFLGVVFVSVFNIVALTIQKTGVVIGTLFQKMSLLFPVIAAMLFFGEDIIAKRIIGIGLAVLSIVVINLPSSGDDELSKGIKKYWYLPLLTLLGSGLIELLLYYVEVKGIAPNGDISFVTFLFFTAGVCGLTYKIISRKWSVSKNDLLAGIGLGIPNFFSIYLLLKSLASGVDATVMFPFINVGTILSGVLLGYIAFNESMGKTKTIGVLIAIAAICLIVIEQEHFALIVEYFSK